MDIIKHINLEMLRMYSNQESYADDYLFITTKLENLFIDNQSVKLDVFLMIYCMKGNMDLEVNNIPIHLGNNDLFVCLPNTLVRQIKTDEVCTIKIICFSNRFIRRLVQTNKNTWKSINYIQRNPVKHFENENKWIFHQYLSLIETKSLQATNKYQKEILLHIASAFFGELIAETTQRFIETTPSDFIQVVKQPDFIFKQFMELLSADDGSHRTLHYYAEILGYSAKYLSKVIKETSGKNALALIHENAIEHIITELRHSNKSIKEIAVAFDFPNVSFFAQYIKKHLGTTPSEFRSNSQYLA